jgi:hypothetical protein
MLGTASASSANAATTRADAAFTGPYLHVVLSVDEQLYHQERDNAGAWGPLQYQTSAPGEGSGPYQAIWPVGASTDAEGDLQVVVAHGDEIFHEIRYANGTWQKLEYNTGVGLGIPEPITGIAAAVERSTGILDVVISAGDQIWHEQRYANGTWSKLDYQTSVPGGGIITAIGASTDPNGDLQVVVADGDEIWHEIRYTNGTWQKLEYNAGAGSGIPTPITGIAAAVEPSTDTLDVTVSAGTQIWHEQRYSNGTWSKFDYQTSAPGTINDIGASTDSAGDLLVVVAVDYKVYHEVRYVSNGSWSDLYYDASAPTYITSIAAADDQ